MHYPAKNLSEIAWPPKKIELRFREGNNRILLIDGEEIGSITDITFQCPLTGEATISIHYAVYRPGALGHGVLEIPVVGTLDLTSYWADDR